MNMNERQQVNTIDCKCPDCGNGAVEIKRLDMPLSFISCSFCKKKREDEREEEKKKIEEENKFRFLNAQIPERYIGARLNDFKDDDMKSIVKWCANPNEFLFIHSECGTGKTHLACSITYELRIKYITK